MHPAAAALDRARRLHEQGVVEFNRGHPDRSVRTLYRALRAVGDTDATDEHRRLTAAIWISIALGEAEMHGLERGLAAFSDARRFAERSDDPALQVRARYQYGTIALRAGRLHTARAELAAAAALIDHAEPADKYAILLNNGVLSLSTMGLREARDFLQRAARQARVIADRSAEFKALHNLGYAEFLAGNLPAALRAMDDADRIDVEVSRGVALLDRARVLTEAGLVREADAALSSAAALFRRDRSGQDLAETTLARAESALLLGDVDAARRFAAQARARFRKRGNERWRRNAERLVLTADLMRGRGSRALATRARQLAGELAADDQPAQARTALLLAAEALLDLGRVGEAREVIVEAGRPARGETIPARLHSRYLRARLAAACGDRPGATREFRSGLGDLAAYQARFGSLDLQTASAVHGRRLAELGRAVAVAEGMPWAVLAAVELGRAVSSRLPSVRPPADERAAELLADLRRVIEESRTAQGESATRMAQRRRQLEREITARSWTLAGHGRAQRPASREAIRAALDAAGATLVSYLQVGSELHAVVAGARRARLVPLGPAAPVVDLIRRLRADLDVLAHDLLPGELRAAASGSQAATLAALDNHLVAPLRLPERRVVITPTGPLATVPWSMVPSLAGVPVTVAPTATAWRAASTAPGHGEGVAALAGPDLPRAADEVTKIAAGWPRAHAHDRADRETLATALTSRQLVHVAAHGTHQPENPLFSAIRLTDGPLFAYELDQAPEHVVLSACELGLATIRPGDEALGLTSVLLRLGSRCVVAGVARVRDEVAAEVMVRYHAALAGGQDSAQALAEALATQPAPFVCFGAPWRPAGFGR